MDANLKSIANQINRSKYPDIINLPKILPNYKYIGLGRHRITFLHPSGRFVIKFPKNYDGVCANMDEHDTYREAFDGKSVVKYAPCRLLYDSLLMMWVVDPIFQEFEMIYKIETSTGHNIQMPKSTKIPLWANYYVDSQQVGFLKDLRIVAYDFSKR